MVQVVDDAQPLKERSGPNPAASVGLGLSPRHGVSMRQFGERLYVFDALQNDLFEIDEASAQFLADLPLNRLASANQEEVEFLNECLESNLLSFGPLRHWSRHRTELDVEDAPLYLLVHTTEACNLRCGHCYLGEKKSPPRLQLGTILEAISEFERLGGLVVLLSGGEPLLHPDFWELNERIKSFSLRFELLTNGTLIDDRAIERLNFHEVQVSLDGWGNSHDLLRGPDTFERSVRTVRGLVAAGVAVSVATMITRFNTETAEAFEKLQTFCLSHGVKNWSVNAPCTRGEWEKNRDDAIAARENTIRIASQYGYGEGQHDFGMKYACGGNLCTVMATGDVITCVLMPEKSLGNISEGLEVVWRRRSPLVLMETECRDCAHLDACRGGCRVSALENAGDLLGRDPLQCEAVKRYFDNLTHERGGEP